MTMTRKKRLTKKTVADYVKHKLAKDTKWAQAALLKIYEYQTEDERDREHTFLNNGVGFNGVDGEILSSFAKQLQRRGFLSPKQMDIVFKKMKKYAGQIIRISNKAILESQAARWAGIL